MANIEVIGQVRYGLANASIVEFLCFIDISPTGISGRVEVADPSDVLPDRADNIPFHDLHVINVIKQFHIGAADLFADRHAPGGMVALVTWMVYLRIQQFHVEVDIAAFGMPGDPAQAGSGRLNRLHFIHMRLQVAGKADQAGNVNRRAILTL